MTVVLLDTALLAAAAWVYWGALRMDRELANTICGLEGILEEHRLVPHTAVHGGWTDGKWDDGLYRALDKPCDE